MYDRIKYNSKNRFRRFGRNFNVGRIQKKLVWF